MVNKALINADIPKFVKTLSLGPVYAKILKYFVEAGSTMNFAITFALSQVIYILEIRRSYTCLGKILGEIARGTISQT